ncbi:hypothetical protein shim_06030 [Shimia sp. SK013]|uniref:hypothetical protein n=1 Tax=Shimia sp. SK013 TaxID=1389006 RepID=UPI0006B64531|nr:hypothetical protein [Shimia sp. SK013]KPA22325.1 hypothetical protein shim_06030 [Shimia sp. SK013]
MDWLIPTLAIAIIAMAAVLAWHRRDGSPIEQDDTDPDHHTLRSDYQSGMGGGNVSTWKVPKDPQAYAKLFVPSDKKK